LQTTLWVNLATAIPPREFGIWRLAELNFALF